MAKLSKASEKMDSFMRSTFYVVGKTVATHPWKAILGCVLLTILCGIGFLSFSVENNPEKLYTPQDEQSFKDRKVVEELWGDGYRYGAVYIVRSDKRSVLTTETLLAMMDLVDIVQSTSDTYQGETSTFSSLCTRIGPYCSRRSILDLFGYNRTLISSSTNADILTAINAPVLISTLTGLRLELESMVGGITRDVNGKIESAGALQFNFQLDNHKVAKNGDENDFRAESWEVALMEPILNGFDRSVVTPYLWTTGGQDVIANEAITADAALIPLGCAFMFAFVVLVLSRRHPIMSQAGLTVPCIVAVILSTFSAFGLVSTFQHFSLVVQASIVLLLGIGVDDTFVIMNSLHMTDSSLPIVERVAQALSISGSAITVTSMTDFCAFLVGSYSSLSAIHVFCMYSAFGVLIDWFFQITFYVGWVTLDLRRQAASRLDCLCCISAKVSDNKACIVPAKPFDIHERGMVGDFISRVIATVVLHPIGKVAVLVLACGLLGVSIYGTMGLKNEFDVESFIPDDGNYIKKSFEIRDKYFKNSRFGHEIYFMSGDYFANQNELVAVTQGLPEIKHIIPESIVNWHTSFHQWLASSQSGLSNSTLTSQNYVPYLLSFLSTPQGNSFSRFVKIENNTIVGTRIYFQAQGRASDEMISTMDDARKIAKRAPNLHAFAYQSFYVFMDGLKVSNRELLRNLLMSGGAVLGICAILLAHIPLALLVIGMLVMIDFEILGYAYFAGLSYNSVTVINCLVSVGLAVDYNVHVAHVFMAVQGTRTERAKQALRAIGPAVLCGAFSTFLPVAALGLAVSYIFRVFFQLFSVMVLVSLFHGMCVLPVILSFIGPAPHTPTEDVGLKPTVSL